MRARPRNWRSSRTPSTPAPCSRAPRTRATALAADDDLAALDTEGPRARPTAPAAAAPCGRRAPPSTPAPCVRTGGGSSRPSQLSSWSRSSSTRPGERSRTPTTILEPYISPFYSPCMSRTACRGPATCPPVGDWWTLSPALLVLVLPLGFRLTCYYYRKAYYRSFWLSPPACAVAEPHRRYTGETRFPLILKNMHRYFFYRRLAGDGVLDLDAVLGLPRPRRGGGHGPRHADLHGERRAALGSSPVVQLVPAHHRRAADGTSPSTRCATQAVDLRVAS